MSKAYVFLAEGFEEVEALATVDVLRRGGVDALTVSITENPEVEGAHGIKVLSDLDWNSFLAAGVSERDAMIFPGGMPGTRNLAGKKELIALMKSHYAGGGLVCAICAAPGLVLSQLDGIAGKRFTCYDGFEEFPLAKGAEYVKAPAVVDGQMITGRGPAFAIDFGLAIVRSMKGKGAADSVREGLLLA